MFEIIAQIVSALVNRLETDGQPVEATERGISCSLRKVDGFWFVQTKSEHVELCAIGAARELCTAISAHGAVLRENLAELQARGAAPMTAEERAEDAAIPAPYAAEEPTGPKSEAELTEMRERLEWLRYRYDAERHAELDDMREEMCNLEDDLFTHGEKKERNRRGLD